MRLSSAAALAALALLPSHALPGLTEDLRDRLAEAHQGTMSFEQEVTDPDGVLITSRGTLAYERPARFFVEYLSPDRISIVSDGKTVWVHDQELEQVIVTEIERSPAARGFLQVLSSQGDLSGFATDSRGGGDGISWLVLEPHDAELASFERCEVGFDPDGVIVAVRLTDLAGNSLRARFSDIDGARPDGSIFTFIPPEGVEVINQ